MSVRLVTTPWLTKNLAGGGLDTRRLLGGRRGTDGDGTARAAADDPFLAARRSRVRAAGRVSSSPCSSPSTSATRTSRSACSGPARCSPRDAPRRTRGRRPTSSSCCSTGCCGSTASPSRDLDAIALASVVPALTGARRGHRRTTRSAAARRRRRARSRSRSASTGRARSVPTGWSTRSPRPGCTGRRPSSSTSGRRRRSTAWRRTALRRRRDRAGARARARGARGTDRQAATDRAARAGPGDRPGHREGHAVRHDLRLPGARRRPARRGSGASWPTPTASLPADVQAILTGGLSAAPWAAPLEGIDAIDPDLTLKGLAILHAEVGGGEPLELGLA